MPNRRCQGCKRVQGVSPADYKYLSPIQEDFICSKACLRPLVEAAELSMESMLAAIPIKRSRANEAYSNSLQSFFRSQYEVQVAEHLVNDLGFKSLSYEEYGFIMSDGSQYVPDFLIEGHCFIEVKGRWGIGAKKKFANFRRTYSNIPLLLIHWTLFREFFPEDVSCLQLK